MFEMIAMKTRFRKRFTMSELIPLPVPWKTEPETMPGGTNGTKKHITARNAAICGARCALSGE